MFTSALRTFASDRPRSLTIGGGTLGVVGAVIEVVAITAVSIASGTIWHLAAYGRVDDIQHWAGVGLLTGLLYVLPFLFATDYRADRFVARSRTLSRILNVWTYAFFVLAALAFLTKTTGSASRGGLVLFFLAGTATVVATDALLSSFFRAMIASGRVRARRLLIVGEAAPIARFTTHHRLADGGFQVVDAIAVDSDPIRTCVDGDGLEAHVARAMEIARTAGVLDVLILTDDSNRPGIGARIADRFMQLPVNVHLGELAVARQFPQLSVGRIGKAQTLALCHAPLDPFQRALKRLLDVVGAAVGLVLLVPLFLVVAVLIKLDSPGPAFFLQRRHGFNQRQFRIWKFRTMSTLDDGAHVAQAVANDPRVTRVGRWLRRYNIDELPQLINVLFGQMSLVGPRPHAIAHDKYFERAIRRYPRRLNVKPGITGWAQVNGFRGLTETEHAMRSRLAHDLYYIDNWSIALDLYIIVLTVVSPKAFRNAN